MDKWIKYYKESFLYTRTTAKIMANRRQAREPQLLLLKLDIEALPPMPPASKEDAVISTWMPIKGQCCCYFYTFHTQNGFCVFLVNSLAPKSKPEQTHQRLAQRLSLDHVATRLLQKKRQGKQLSIFTSQSEQQILPPTIAPRMRYSLNTENQFNQRNQFHDGNFSQKWQAGRREYFKIQEMTYFILYVCIYIQVYTHILIYICIYTQMHTYRIKQATNIYDIYIIFIPSHQEF